VLAKDEIVEIVLNNNDPGKHPFHLHGHVFQVVVRSEDDAGNYDPTVKVDMPASPMRRDTVLVRPDGHIVLRFKADNPGVWLFHCHIEWFVSYPTLPLHTPLTSHPRHVASGLIATMVEAPLSLQESLTLPADHLAACKVAGTPTVGNAAGNVDDVLNLDGQNAPASHLPAGFTARGIVALVFSCLSAFLGIAAIAWYGVVPLGKEEEGRMEGRIAKE
jgi:iron transport multicopper oxidase